MAGDTIFGRILRGEIPCHRVYEDEHVLAFLDIAPIAEGHTLVLPREPAARLDELSPEAAAHLGGVLPRLCRAVMAATGAPAYNVVHNSGAEAGQVVAHVHFHIVPRWPQDGIRHSWPAGRLAPQRAADLLAAMHAELARS